MIKVLISVTLVLAAVGNAHAISKCLGADGKIVFQDAPCAGKGEEIKVTPASGHSAPVQSSKGGVQPAQTNQYQRQYESLRDERVRREKWLEMASARKALDDARAHCEAEQKKLADSKNWSKNNLAGATRDVSISQEMTAAAMVCDSRTRQREKELTDAESVCKEIKCISPN